MKVTPQKLFIITYEEGGELKTWPMYEPTLDQAIGDAEEWLKLFEGRSFVSVELATEDLIFNGKTYQKEE